LGCGGEEILFRPSAHRERPDGVLIITDIP
jgi:hypothetical protein